jgi:hypothetical protein
MKLNLIITITLATLTISGRSQSIIGHWQLVKESTCLEEQLPNDTSDTEDLVRDMKAMNDKTPQIIKFTDHQSGEESTKILNTRKNVNTKHFLYKIDGNNLYILDKKSRTLAETYSIDSLQGDTLILSNSARPCETKVFVRIKP